MNIIPTQIFQYRPALKTKQYKNESLQNDRTITDRISALERKQTSIDSIPHKNTPESAVNVGLEQEATGHARKAASDKRLVEDLVRQSNRRIMSISSTFPWTIFPNTIDIEESRVTFNFRQFMSYQSHSVDLKDITNVFIESGFFFATLQVVSRTYIQNEIKIAYLKKNQAVKARRIIEGMRTFVYNNIDTSNYEITELLSKLEELHVTDHINNPRMAV